jgi:hypothetical protein
MQVQGKVLLSLQWNLIVTNGSKKTNSAKKYITEDRTLHNHSCENPKSYIVNEDNLNNVGCETSKHVRNKIGSI